MPQTIRIKKYANRRLYDTHNSTYVTLEQVADMITGGAQVVVFDAKTNEDVTAIILSQIVMEKARQKNILLPAPLLHLIIRHGDTVLGDFFDNYLEQIIQHYLNYKNSVDAQFGKWLDMGMGLSGMAHNTLSDLNPFQEMFTGRGNPPPDAPRDTAAPSKDSADTE